MWLGDLKASLRIAAKKSIHKTSSSIYAWGTNYIDRYNQGKFEFQARRYVMAAWSHQTMDGLKAG